MTQTVETSEPTDGVLLKRLSAGDKAAWDTLVRRHADTVFSVVSRIVRRPSDAEDAGQEAFLRLKEYAHTFDAARYGDQARSWIATIACREALKINARRAATKDVPYDDEIGGGPASSASQGNATVEEREIHALLRSAVEALPQRQREAIVMHFAAGLTQTEIATELGCDQSTVSDRLRQGLDKLRQRFGAADAALALAPATLAASLLQPAPPAFVNGLINHSDWASAAVTGAKTGTAAVSTVKAAFWIMAAMAGLSLGLVALKNFGVERGLAASQLGSFEDNTLQGWEPLDASKLSVVQEHAGDGTRALRIDMAAAPFPGVRKKFERLADWRSYRALRATLFNGGAKPLNLSVRIDDENSAGFGTRFNFDDGFHLAPGSNEVEIPIGQLWNGSLFSRGLNVDKISEVRFFLNGAAEPATLWLDNIRLVPLKGDTPDVIDLLQANSHVDPVGESTFMRDGNPLLSVSMPAGKKFTGFELFALNDWLPYDELTVELNENGSPLPGGIFIKVMDDTGRHTTLNTRAIAADGKLHLPVELFGQVALGRVKTVSLFCETLKEPRTLDIRRIQLLRRAIHVLPSRHSAVESDPLILDFASLRSVVRANAFQAVIWIPHADGALRSIYCNSEGTGVTSYSVPAEDLKNLDTTRRIRIWSYFHDHGVWYWKYIEAKKNPDGPLKITYDSLDGWSK